MYLLHVSDRCIRAQVSVLTVVLLLHAAFYSMPGFKEPSRFWTLLDVITSVVRPMFMSSSQFYSENLGLLNQFAKNFYLGDLIDIQIKQWSGKIIYVIHK